jgi:hypothetical protein
MKASWALKCAASLWINMLEDEAIDVNDGRLPIEWY